MAWGGLGAKLRESLGALRIFKTTPEWSRMVVSVMNVPKEIGARIFYCMCMWVQCVIGGISFESHTLDALGEVGGYTHAYAHT